VSIYQRAVIMMINTRRGLLDSLSTWLIQRVRRNPTLEEGPEWPKYNRTHPVYMELNGEKVGLTGRGPRAKECAFWNELMPHLKINSGTNGQRKSYIILKCQWITHHCVNYWLRVGYWWISTVWANLAIPKSIFSNFDILDQKLEYGVHCHELYTCYHALVVEWTTYQLLEKWKSKIPNLWNIPVAKEILEKLDLGLDNPVGTVFQSLGLMTSRFKR
jgi:hypothetical protein